MSQFKIGLIFLGLMIILMFIEFFSKGQVVNVFEAEVFQSEIVSISLVSSNHRYLPATSKLPSGEVIAIECSGAESGDLVEISVQKTPLLRRIVYRCMLGPVI